MAADSTASPSGADDTSHQAPLPDRSTLLGKILFGIALVFATWQIYTAAYSPLSSIVLRSMHVGFLLLMVYSASSAREGRPLALRGLDWAFGIAAMVTGVYQWIFETDLILRAGLPSTEDIRITSYNVCYTKLLREREARHLFDPAVVRAEHVARHHLEAEEREDDGHQRAADEFLDRLGLDQVQHVPSVGFRMSPGRR